jgi:hypothetical protein
MKKVDQLARLYHYVNGTANKGQKMFTKNIFNTKKDPIADLIAPILEAQTKAKMEELKGQQHKIDKNKNGKIDAHDFKILRGEKKAVKEESESLEEGLIGGGYTMKQKHEGKYRIHAPNGEHVGDITKEPGPGKWRHHAGGSKWDGTETSPHYKTGVSNNIIDAAKKVAEIHKSSVNEAVSPFDWKNRPSQLKTKPGEKAGFDSKKTSTGTVYSRKPPKPEKDDMKEEIDPNDTTVDTLKGREKTSNNPFLSKKVKMDVPDNVKEEAEQIEAEALIENIQIINEVSLGAKIRAYAQHSSDAFAHGDMGNDDEAEHHEKRAEKILSHIQRHHGDEAVKHAQKAAHSAIFGRDDPHGHGDGGHDVLHGGLRGNQFGFGGLHKGVTKSGKIPKNTQNAMKNKIKGYGGRGRDLGAPKGHLPEEVEQVEERTLSKGETAEKERIVKGMKKNLAGFKARYGERAKSVMYATATKAAKKD